MKNKSYKHWIIVALMSCLAASSIGLCQNAVGVFYTPVSDDLGVLRGTFALHATLSTLSTAVVSLFLPRIMNRVSYKKILLFGVILAVGATAMMGIARSMWMFYILGIIRGIGAGTFAIVPLTMIITNWFEEMHGRATSIALSCSGLAGAIFSPLLSSWIINYGWQVAYFLKAGFILLFTLPALCYPLTITPKEVNLLPYGFTQKVEIEKQHHKKVFKTITISFLCMCLLTVLHTSITGVSQHLSGFSTSIGLTATFGATLMSMTMCGNIISKLIIGFLSDLLTPLKACIIMIIINIISLVLLLMGGIMINPTLLLISSFIFGSIYSVGAVGIPLLTRYFFGNENYSSAFAKIGFLTSVGSSSSLTFIGYLYDFTGTYNYVMIIAIAFHLFNLGMLYLVVSHYKKDYPRMDYK